MEQAITSLEEVPGASRVSAGGLRHAAGNVARIFVMIVCLFTLVLARWGAPVSFLIVLVAGSLVVLYAIDRKSGRFGIWAAYFVGFILFALLRTLADGTGIPVRGGYVVHADEWLFGGTLPQYWLQRRFYHPGSVGALEIFGITIIFSYYLLPHVLGLSLWRRRRDEFKRYAVAVLLTVYLGLLVSFFLPTAPPWLANRYTDAPPINRVEGVVLHWNPENVGPDSSAVAGSNPFAAMPSLHFAVTLIIVAAFWRRRYGRLLALLYAAAMAFVLVYMGEHYVVDELAAVATAALAWAAATRFVRVRAPESQLAAPAAAVPAAAPSPTPASATAAPASATSRQS
jgi:hypothetical protein